MSNPFYGFSGTNSSQFFNGFAGTNSAQSGYGFPTQSSGSLIFGNGADGEVTVSAFAPDTTAHNTNRTQPDAYALSVAAIGSSSVTTSSDIAAGGFNPGDEVVLYYAQGNYSLQADGTNMNVGNFEFFRVAGASGRTVQFKTRITKVYTKSLSNADFNSTNDKVIVKRVPNYRNLTITSSGTCAAWDGSVGGCMFFRVQNTLNNTAVISATGLGCRTTPKTRRGESPFSTEYNSQTSVNRNITGGATDSDPGENGGPGGGGNRAAGGISNTGTPQAGSKSYATDPTTTQLAMAKLIMGGSGGGSPDSGASVGTGGAGGGVVFISSKFITSLNVTSNGGNGANEAGGNIEGGAGGAGGSVLVQANSIAAVSQFKVFGGDGGIGNGLAASGGIGGGTSGIPTTYTGQDSTYSYSGGGGSAGWSLLRIQSSTGYLGAAPAQGEKAIISGTNILPYSTAVTSGFV